MAPLILHADCLLTPAEEIRDAAVWVEDGLVTFVGRRESVRAPSGAREIYAKGKTIVPGFVDVHIHGASGHDVMEGSTEALASIAGAVARHGTTSFAATTVTASIGQICKSAEGIARYIQRQRATGKGGPSAEVLGIHFEGPFISPVRRGVHPADWLALPSEATLARFLSAANGTARILTLAPELSGAMACIAAARNAGVAVALGHTDATYEQAMAAIHAGAHHAVHVYNAMRPFSHRETGVLGAVLTEASVTAELIADGVHVDEPAMRLLLRAKGVERMILVSDGTAATGMPDGRYTLGTFAVDVIGGVCRNAEGNLAGSTLTLDRALRNVAGMGVPLADSLAMLTTNPARLLGLEAKKGVLREGADADLLLLDSECLVTGVMTRGIGLEENI